MSVTTNSPKSILSVFDGCLEKNSLQYVNDKKITAWENSLMATTFPASVNLFQLDKTKVVCKSNIIKAHMNKVVPSVPSEPIDTVFTQGDIIFRDGAFSEVSFLNLKEQEITFTSLSNTNYSSKEKLATLNADSIELHIPRPTNEERNCINSIVTHRLSEFENESMQEKFYPYSLQHELANTHRLAPAFFFKKENILEISSKAEHFSKENLLNLYNAEDKKFILENISFLDYEYDYFKDKLEDLPEIEKEIVAQGFKPERDLIEYFAADVPVFLDELGTTRGIIFSADNSSSVMNFLGGMKKEILINPDVMNKAWHDNNIPLSILKKLPEYIYDPTVVFKRGTVLLDSKESNFIFIANELNDRKLIAIDIKLQKEKHNILVTDIHSIDRITFVSTKSGYDVFEGWGSKGQLQYVNDKTIANSIIGTGALPIELSQSDETKVATKSNIVKAYLNKDVPFLPFEFNGKVFKQGDIICRDGVFSEVTFLNLKENEITFTSLSNTDYSSTEKMDTLKEGSIPLHIHPTEEERNCINSIITHTLSEFENESMQEKFYPYSLQHELKHPIRVSPAFFLKEEGILAVADDDWFLSKENLLNPYNAEDKKFITENIAALRYEYTDKEILDKKIQEQFPQFLKEFETQGFKTEPLTNIPTINPITEQFNTLAIENLKKMELDITADKISDLLSRSKDMPYQDLRTQLNPLMDEVIAQSKIITELLSQFIPPNQFKSTPLDMHSSLYEALENIPGISENPEHKVALHYFFGETDIYVTEWDRDDPDIVYGFTILNGDAPNAEWGYSSIEEITRSHPLMNLDYYHDKNMSVEQVRYEKYPDYFSQPKQTPNRDLTEAENQAIASIEDVEISYNDSITEQVNTLEIEGLEGESTSLQEVSYLNTLSHELTNTDNHNKPVFFYSDRGALTASNTSYKFTGIKGKALNPYNAEDKRFIIENIAALRYEYKSDKEMIDEKIQEQFPQFERELVAQGFKPEKSFRESFNTDVAEFVLDHKTPKDNLFSITNTSSVLNRIDGMKNEIIISADVISKANIPLDVLKKLPEIVYNPIAIFKSDTVDSDPKKSNSFLITDQYADYKPIFIDIEFQKQNIVINGFRIIDNITSMVSYEKRLDLLQSWVSKDLLQYVNDKDIGAWIYSNKIVFPLRVSKLDETKVASKSNIVKAYMNKDVVESKNVEPLTDIPSHNPIYDTLKTDSIPLHTQSTEDIFTPQELATDNKSIKETEQSEPELEKYVYTPTVDKDGVIDYTAVKPDKIYLANKKTILSAELPSYLPPIEIRADLRYVIPPIKITDNVYHLKGMDKTGKENIYRVSLDVYAALTHYHLEYTRAFESEYTKRNEKRYDEALKVDEKYYYHLGSAYRDALPKIPVPFKWDAVGASTDFRRTILSDEKINFRPNRVSFGSKKPRTMPSEHHDFIRGQLGYKLPITSNQNRDIFRNRDGCLEDLQQKLLDMELQKNDWETSWTKGRETAYGDSNLDTDLLEKYGVSVKRQNDDIISSEEKKELSKVLDSVYSVYGDLSASAKAFSLKISHAGSTRMHASKFVGVFSPYQNAIGVSFAEGLEGASVITAHEFAHFTDHLAGKKLHAWHASDIPGTLENKIAVTFRDKMLPVSGDYWNRTCECFARAMEEYCNIEFLKKEQPEITADEISAVVSRSAYMEYQDFQTHLNPLIDELREKNRYVLNTTAYQAEEQQVVSEEPILKPIAAHYELDLFEPTQEYNTQNHDFYTAIDNYLKKGISTKNNEFVLPHTPDILQYAGMGDNEIVLSTSIIKKARNTHNLSNEDIISALKQLSDPVLIFDTDREKSESIHRSVLLVTNTFKENKPISIAIALDVEKVQGKKRVIVNAIRSIHDRSLIAKNGVPILNEWNKKGLLKYVDDKKITEWSETTREQFPGSSTHSVNSSIKTKSDYVNHIISENSKKYVTSTDPFVTRDVINNAKAVRRTYTTEMKNLVTNGWDSFRKFEKHGIFDITGQTVKTDENGKITSDGWVQMVQAMRIYRDKHFETLRFAFVNKTGTIQDQITVSSHMPNTILIPGGNFMEDVIEYAEKTNTSIVAIHNHPSGNTQPSVEDMNVTDKFNKTLIDSNGQSLFQGHIILDHDTFGLYEVSNDEWKEVDSGVKEKDPLMKDILPNFASQKILTPEDLIEIAKSINSNEKWNCTDWVPVLFVSSPKISSIRYYSKETLGGLENSEKIKEMFQTVGKTTGSTLAFLIVPDELSGDKDFLNAIKIHTKNGCFTDFYMDGKTAEDYGLNSHTKAIFEDVSRDELRKNTVFDSTFTPPSIERKREKEDFQVAEITVPEKSDTVSDIQKNTIKNDVIENTTEPSADIPSHNPIAEQINTQKIEEVEAQGFKPENSLIESFDSAVSDFCSGHKIPKDNLFTVGNSSSVMGCIGGMNSEIVMSTSVINKAINKHNIPVEVLKKVPELLYDPIAVFKSDPERSEAKQNSVLFVTNQFSGGKPIVIGIELQKEKQIGRGRQNIVVNDIRTIHARDLVSQKSGHGIFAGWFENGLLQYVNDKKITDWTKSARVSFPLELSQSDKLTIPCKSNLVKGHMSKDVIENKTTDIPCHNPITGQIYPQESVRTHQQQSQSDDKRYLQPHDIDKLGMTIKPEAESVVNTYRKENESGQTVQHCERLFNGKDIEGMPPPKRILGNVHIVPMKILGSEKTVAKQAERGKDGGGVEM